MEIVRWKKSKKNGDKNKSDVKSSHRRTVACIELSTRHLYRRAFSEMSLLDVCGTFDFKDGESYHFITAGDVDSLSYLKAVLRQQSLDHCLLSTWCMAAEDILQLQMWCNEGKIKKLDIYVGEIFPSTYKIEYAMLVDMFADNGRNVGGGAEWQYFVTTQKFTLGLGINSHLGLKRAQMSIQTLVQKMVA